MEDVELEGWNGEKGTDERVGKDGITKEVGRKEAVKRRMEEVLRQEGRKVGMKEAIEERRRDEIGREEVGH